MNWQRIFRTGLIGLLSIGPAIAAAQPITVPGLQRALQQAPQGELRFHETRESPWLAAPIESSGTVKSSATMLEKRVELPRRETWRIGADRVELITPESSVAKEFNFSQSPAVAALANALRQVIAGNLQALGEDFHLLPGGDERLWTVQLTPRRPDIARYLKQLELQGTGAHLQVIVILESQGERTTMRLIHER